MQLHGAPFRMLEMATAGAIAPDATKPAKSFDVAGFCWLRGQDLNL